MFNPVFKLVLKRINRLLFIHSPQDKKFFKRVLIFFLPSNTEQSLNNVLCILACSLKDKETPTKNNFNIFCLAFKIELNLGKTKYKIDK